MNRNDLSVVGALSDQLGYPLEMSDLKARFEKISTLPHHALLVSEDETVTGWIHLEAVNDLIKSPRIEIKALVVNENRRGMGTGSSLIQSAVQWAKTYGSNTIYLSCNIMRDRAHAFYEREGFVKVKTSHFFELKI